MIQQYIQNLMPQSFIINPVTQFLLTQKKKLQDQGNRCQNTRDDDDDDNNNKDMVLNF